jgi:hypothetical protein
MKTKVLITIDTESDNLWDPDLRKNPKFKNISELPTLQRIFDKFGARPTYLVTFSVAKSDPVSILKDIAKSQNCEIGTHLHAPETPPFERHTKGDGSYLHQYSFDSQRRKVSSIDKTIAETFGKKPVSYRAGRYSFDKNAASLLVEHGYLVDTSVTPGISWENDGGINFKKHNGLDHFLGTGEYALLEVPVSIKIKTRFPAIAKYIYLNTPNWTHAEGILRRLTFFDIIWLDPSFNTYEEMEWLCNVLLNRNACFLNIMFHSSVIIPGGTPYTPKEKDVKEFFERLERLLDYLLRVKKLDSLTLKEFYDIRSKKYTEGVLP